ncbi:hypothetical protein L4N02_04940 [Klebsiella variicola]|uniref:hypothetical protein n=1 Tax=Klebsiella variicola TaxID=244366 RepID=UPI001F383AFD|nr:hypothetical protein [Klebsiella variicola]MCF7061828.1 hypothetical protein [Klebsiella variicola]MCF7094117.1 hypothetical protein [Klebsiella variicola]
MFNVTLKNQQIDIYLNGYRVASEQRDISVEMVVTRVYGLPDGTLNAVVEIITDEQSIPHGEYPVVIDASSSTPWTEQAEGQLINGEFSA